MSDQPEISQSDLMLDAIYQAYTPDTDAVDGIKQFFDRHGYWPQMYARTKSALFVGPIWQTKLQASVVTHDTTKEA